eukprot:COSAG02_NODE_524_length_20723_cov_79.399438_19_plen_79_part_00
MLTARIAYLKAGARARACVADTYVPVLYLVYVPPKAKRGSEAPASGTCDAGGGAAVCNAAGYGAEDSAPSEEQAQRPF